MLTVAMDDPTNLDKVQEIAFATGCSVGAVYTTAETIDQAVEARTGNLVELAGSRVSRTSRTRSCPTKKRSAGPTAMGPTLRSSDAARSSST